MEAETTLAERSGVVRRENERIFASAVRLKFADDQRAPFVCECGDAHCLGTLMLRLAVYARLRKERCLFILLPGHQSAAGEEVTEDRRDLGYVVVERVASLGGASRN